MRLITNLYSSVKVYHLLVHFSRCSIVEAFDAENFFSVAEKSLAEMKEALKTSDEMYGASDASGT